MAHSGLAFRLAEFITASEVMQAAAHATKPQRYAGGCLLLSHTLTKKVWFQKEMLIIGMRGAGGWPQASGSLGRAACSII